MTRSLSYQNDESATVEMRQYLVSCLSSDQKYLSAGYQLAETILHCLKSVHGQP